MPERIQLKRSRGWRKPEGAVVVSRPSLWGNPFTITQRRDEEGWPWFVVWWPGGIEDVDWFQHMADARRVAVLMYRGHITGEFDLPAFDLSELTGKDLACWCPLDEPCHADVLLDLANPGDAA